MICGSHLEVWPVVIVVVVSSSRWGVGKSTDKSASLGVLCCVFTPFLSHSWYVLAKTCCPVCALNSKKSGFATFLSRQGSIHAISALGLKACSLGTVVTRCFLIREVIRSGYRQLCVIGRILVCAVREFHSDKAQSQITYVEQPFVTAASNWPMPNCT